ncbi:casein kinase substrate phosphoprotein PP28-domain-containing protein [Crassisporium funariophilum]|nr:casein kinase substrate phosphoprotein PP28-domain-containing protein [Crassisporium funariophilum]
MVRGSGKFKQKRGGGRNFSKEVSFNPEERARAARRRELGEAGEGDSEEDSEEEDEEEESEEESEEEVVGAPSNAPAGPELSRTERRDLKKKQAADKATKEEEDPDLINPNHVTQKMNISDLNSPRELSRREREQKEKQEAKDRYWKLHVQGKTDEAKADLSRLAKIRAERETALAKRKAEAESKVQEAEAKKKAQLTKRG